MQFRTTVSGPTEPEETGLILDLSRGGCRLESPLLMLPGLSLELRIYVPGLEWPLMIDGADVQWVSERTVGLAFVRIREAEQQRLDEVLTARLARKSEDGDEEQCEAGLFEFQELEKALSKDPQLAISKGLLWFAQNREQFQFRGGLLLSRALPKLHPGVRCRARRVSQSRRRYGGRFLPGGSPELSWYDIHLGRKTGTL